MKKIIKNILLSFVIIYTVLNLVLYGINVVSRNKMSIEMAEEVRQYNQAYEEGREIETSIELELEKEYIQGIRDIYGENALVTRIVGYQNYLMGMCRILDAQITILIATLIISTAIGVILSLTEKPKVKELLCFITGGISFVLLCTACRYATGEYLDFDILEEIFEIINSYGIYYIIGYLVKIVYRYCKNKKSVKELNKELKTKNK